MTANATTPIFSAAFLAEDRSSSVLAAAISTFSLATIAVILRIIARRITAAKLWWDDYFIFLAYVCRLPPLTDLISITYREFQFFATGDFIVNMICK